MGKKTNKQENCTGTCARCANGMLIPTEKGNPRIARCYVLGKNFVADSKRKCFYARWL